MASSAGKEIKERMNSIESTHKITKAMGLVASSKMAKVRSRVERSRPYFQIMYETLNEIASSDTEFQSPYLAVRDVNSTCVVVIGADRGLAGGYNSALLKKTHDSSNGKNAKIFPIGKKCVEYYERINADVLSTEYNIAADLTVGNCFEISKSLCDAFLEGEFDEIILVYTNFVSMLEQTASEIKVLPFMREHQNQNGNPKQVVVYEPSSEEVYNAIVPEYVAGLLYGALCESLASEQAARRTAMDSASKNAEDMLETLTLQYNRARQGAITQEITEIVAGSEE
ncbi:MAG: ATP synthase F1 subunit gamma [Eubacteriales bacterium]|nr:ATP synthase F1 subunit gamma [Eubacteriales bacterium]